MFGANYFGLIYPAQSYPLPLIFTQGLADGITLTDVTRKSITIVEADGITLTDTTGKSITIVEADTITLLDATGKSITIVEADGITLTDTTGKSITIIEADIITLIDAASLTPTPGRRGGGGGAWYIQNLDKMIRLNLFNTIGLQELKNKPEFRKKEPVAIKPKISNVAAAAAARKNAREADRKRFVADRDLENNEETIDNVKIAIQVATAAAVVVVMVGGIIVAVKKAK